MRILYNGSIRTQQAGNPPVSAVAIENGRIIATGSDADVLALANQTTIIEDLYRQTVWPGLTDAHAHLENYSLALRYIDCETQTKEECLRLVRERAEQAKPGEWILGHGWNQNLWPEGFGTANELDAAAPGHPVFLTAKSLHAAWANHAALAIAGLSAQSPDPEGGILARDHRGDLTGILLENAMNLLYAVVPFPNLDQTTENIYAAQQKLWQMGITGVHDFDQRSCFMALQKLEAEGRLRLRINKGIPADDLNNAVELGLRSGFGSDFLRIGSVKLFADGALGPQTAAMISPYENDSNQLGVLLLDGEQIFEIGRTAAKAGISIATHAIGDRANHEVLNGYALLRDYEHQNMLPALRHRIEHVQILHPQDLKRLAELDVIASMQPIHATSDMNIADQYWGDRSQYAYAPRTLLENNTHLAFGSDAPVESPNPFLGLHAAVTRQRPNGEPGADGWYPQQRLSLEQALAAFTTGAAYAALQEKQLGSLGSGYLADLIVLKQDPFTLPPEDLYTVQPVATMVAGEWVWGEA